MESFDKGVERVTTALAYLACAVIPCMFTLIVVDVSMRTVGIAPTYDCSSDVQERTRLLTKTLKEMHTLLGGYPNYYGTNI